MTRAQELRDVVRQLHAAGVRMSVIAARLGATRNTLACWLRQAEADDAGDTSPSRARWQPPEDGHAARIADLRALLSAFHPAEL